MSIVESKIYLDYAAATPVASSVLDEMMPYYSDRFFNPSALYLDSIDVKHDLQKYRERVARVIGAKADEIIFTAGATESINMAISGVMRSNSSSNIVISSIEHQAVRQTAQQYDGREVEVDKKGTVDISKLEGQIDDKTALVSVIYANNEIGAVQDLAGISALITKIRNDRKARGVEAALLLHTDASQAGNYLDLHVSRLGVDLLTLNGGKMYGPKQSGILYVRGGSNISPLVVGGGQEFGYRSGTENLASIAGFSKALEVAQAGRKEEAARQSVLQAQLEKGLGGISAKIQINSTSKRRLPNIVNFSIPGVDGERLVMMLDERGIQVATGAACSASSDEPSYVLRSIGLSEELATGSIRVSMGSRTNEQHVLEFLKQFRAALEEAGHK